MTSLELINAMLELRKLKSPIKEQD